MEIKKLEKDLKNLGVKTGDILMVHASLKKVGAIDDDALDVIQAILGVIGANGTMLMVLGSPEDEEFDYLNSRADPEMGMLAECFRNFPGCLVNDHPAARFCAFGADATYLLSETRLHDYYGEGSVLQKLVERNGKVLRLEPNIDTMTLTHFAEYLADVQPKKRVIRQYVCKNRGHVEIESLDDCFGIQQWPDGDYFSQIMLDFQKTHHIKLGTVGQCTAGYFRAKDFIPFAVQWMENHLYR